MALDRRAVGRLLGLVWPGDDRGLRRRLVLTVGLLVGAALLNALVPLLFARAVDRFVAAPDAVLAVPVGLLLAYVLLGWGAKLMNELRWALYGPIEQRLRRRLALRSLGHLHGLSLGFHLDRRTGQVGRVMDTGFRDSGSCCSPEELPCPKKTVGRGEALPPRVFFLFPLHLHPALGFLAGEEGVEGFHVGDAVFEGHGEGALAADGA
jgi:hypothetical protein